MAHLSHAGYEHFYDYGSADSVYGSKSLADIKREYFRGIWTFLHNVSFQYPDEPTSVDVSTVKTLLRTVATPTVLKCETCIKHFTEQLDRMPRETLYSRSRFSRWLVDVHNDVNARQGKIYMPYEDVKKMYLGQFQIEDTDNDASNDAAPIGCPAKNGGGDDDDDDDSGTCPVNSHSGGSDNSNGGGKAKVLMAVLGTLSIGALGVKMAQRSSRDDTSRRRL